MMPLVWPSSGTELGKSEKLIWTGTAFLDELTCDIVVDRIRQLPDARTAMFWTVFQTIPQEGQAALTDALNFSLQETRLIMLGDWCSQLWELSVRPLVEDFYMHVWNIVQLYRYYLQLQKGWRGVYDTCGEGSCVALGDVVVSRRLGKLVYHRRTYVPVTYGWSGHYWKHGY